MSAEGGGGSVDPVLLATRFLPPVPNRGHLRRDRLHRTLARASSTPITVLSAPAGFGKSSLLAAWLTEIDEPWAWLSIDGQDNDPLHLWTHVIAAVRSLAGPVGDGALAALRRRGAKGPASAWLTPLINDLAATSAPDAFLVLDDLHLLVDAEQRAGIGQLARSLPAWLHLVISTRADPPLPLPRLRADHRIIEIRERDLRFAPSEASSMLAAAGMDHLDCGRVELLVEHTEGWAAGLQLATIILAGEEYPGARFDQIVGSRRPFKDYLITEVVDQQSERMRAFLYATSIVDRLNPSLAQAVSGDAAADQLLRDAERQGLFLTALDGGEWYRYHHLFAQALRHELSAVDPDAANHANRAAARWFETHGEAPTALEHWLAAERPDEALRLAVDVGFALVDRGRADAVETIARRIPPSVPGNDPAKQLAFGLLHLVFEPETFIAWVAQASAAMDDLAEPDETLVSQYEMVKSIADLCTGDWDDALVHAATAVRRGAGPGGPTGYGQRAGLQVIRAAGWVERLDESEQQFRAFVGDPRAPEVLRTIVAPAAWALAAAIGGRIDDADHWSGRSIAAAEQGPHSIFSAQDLLLAQGMIRRERGELEAAATAIETLRRAEVQPNVSLQAVAAIELALLRLDQGRHAEAGQVLEAVRRMRSGALGRLVVARLDAAHAELSRACGDGPGARRAAARMPPGLWRDVTTAQCHIVDGDGDAAEALLGPLSPGTPRQTVVVELLRALALADGDRGAARAHTIAALTVAADVGMDRTVFRVGPGVVDLIDDVGPDVPGVWVERADDGRVRAATTSTSTVGSRSRLVEQPTDRERNAARYLPSRLTIAEIARELGISPNTLKTHLRSLYRKLEVTSRQDAVTAARDHGILR
ncbi:MAG: LuxR C-terminal-related transcriptional regulator [Ilumatobacteraceae bacterium]